MKSLRKLVPVITVLTAATVIVLLPFVIWQASGPTSTNSFVLSAFLLLFMAIGVGIALTTAIRLLQLLRDMEGYSLHKLLKLVSTLSVSIKLITF